MMVRGVTGPGADATLFAGAYTRALHAHPARASGFIMCADRYSQSRNRDKGREGNSNFQTRGMVYRAPNFK